MGPDSVGAPVPAVRGGIVSRRALFERLDRAGRVIQVSAPAGSGKTFLLRSWIDMAGLAESTAWVSVRREERSPQGFWLSALSELRQTAAGSAVVRPSTAAPGLDGWAVVERLLKDLESLQDQAWLVIDDVHHLRSAEVLRQLELLLMRAPPELRCVLAARHDVRLGLHRLRLEGEVTEIRAANLRFTLDEARALFGAAGVELPDSALKLLHVRTEGWAAGLRLAALSLAGHPDPERFAAEFSGSERTVAEYLLAEVLERQTEEVRRLLLRTSVLERVSGELADLLTGGTGGERILQDLEEAGAFVVSLDGRRSWFRYHQLFADLLQLELRHTAPGELPALHAAAATWYAGNGHPVEAVRHAQAAEDWGLAARLLSDNWLGLYLGGGAVVDELLAGFPGEIVAASPELTALLAAGDLIRGSLKQARRHLALAAGAMASEPADRRGHLQVLLTVLRLFLARRLVDFSVVSEEAQRLLALAEASDAARLGGQEDLLRAVALVSLGIAEIWALRFEDADRHLEQGVAVARRIRQPYVEFHGLTHWAHGMLLFRPDAFQPKRIRQAIELAERHGWGAEPLAGVSYTALGLVLLYQGRMTEAESWLARAEQTLRTGAEPAAGISLRYARGGLEMACGRHAYAIAAFEAARRLDGTLVTPHPLATPIQAHMLQALVSLGETQRVEHALAEMDAREREGGEMRTVMAVLRLARHDPRGATVALAPVLDGSVRVHPVWVVAATLLEAVARDELGDPAAESAVERALDLAESGLVLFPFLIHPAPGLLERHARDCAKHADLVAEILSLLPERSGGPGSGGIIPPGVTEPSPRLAEPLSRGEIRVLRYLPTNLSAPEIARELSVSVHTVRTHIRHVCGKLGAHGRTEAVTQARALGLLQPSPMPAKVSGF